jgi:hypothetical protein
MRKLWQAVREWFRHWFDWADELRHEELNCTADEPAQTTLTPGSGPYVTTGSVGDFQILGVTYVDLPIGSHQGLQRVDRKPAQGQYLADNFGNLRFNKKDSKRIIEVVYTVRGQLKHKLVSIGGK